MNLREQLDRYGYARTGYDLLLRLLYKGTRGQILNCYRMPKEAVQGSPLAIDARFRGGFLEKDELLDLIDPTQMTMTPEFAVRAFAKGDRCYGVRDGDTLAHFSWFASTPTEVVDGFWLSFPADAVYLYNAYTGHDYRGKLLFPFAVQQAMGALVGQGFQSSVTLIAANNFGSISGVRRIGFAPLGRLALGGASSSFVYASGGCRSNGIKLERCS